MIIFAMSKKDQSWRKAKITGIHYQQGTSANMAAKDYQIDEKFFDDGNDEEDYNEFDEEVD